MSTLLLMLSCAPPKGRPPPPVVEPTADTGSTDPSTTTTGGPDSPAFVQPSARVLSTADVDVGLFVALLPAHDGDPGVILVTGRSDDLGDPAIVPDPALVVRGDLGPGDHDVTAAWDGLVQLDEDWPWGAVVSAGDVDRDGHVDLWFGTRLLRGPFLGRQITTSSDAVLATLDAEYAVAADFDADGDGHLDVITQVREGNQAFVRYGPFSGPISSARHGEADPATYSSLGESFGCLGTGWAGRWLRDHLGPGHDAVAIGVDLNGCTYDNFVWDPFVSRGSHVDYDQALAVVSHFTYLYGDVWLHDPGDVDGDGNPDVIVESGHQVAPGPLRGTYQSFANDLGFWDQMRNGVPARAMGDVNGDGAPELLGKWQVLGPDGVGLTTNVWVLMCSPLALPLDFATGIPLVESHGGIFLQSSFIGMDSVDLDGDGLTDLVDTRVGQEPGGLSIWYGSDLGAACAAPDEASR